MEQVPDCRDRRPSTGRLDQQFAKEVSESPSRPQPARLRGYRTLVLSTLLIFLDSFIQ
jgi:hypothetical protein